MKTRLMAGAFLTYADEVLLLHRGMHKEIAPGMWSCIGGHIEPDELNDPRAACLREIQEEAGIDEAQILSLALKYITMRNTGEEIRTVYYFIGELAEKVDPPACDEGTIVWKKKKDMLDLPMSFSVKQVTTLWQENPDDMRIMLCAVNTANDEETWISL